MGSIKANRDLIDIHKDDLYALLNVTSDADSKSIQKAYRKKALKYHPDKNKDPAAHKIFLKLSQVLELLTDEKSRANYDTLLQARAASRVRHDQLDAKRRKLKDSLEEREKGASGLNSAEAAERQLLETIKKLQSEGETIVMREQQKMREDFTEKTSYFIKDQATLKLKWKCSKEDTTNGGYNFKVLRGILSKYGPLEDIIVSTKRNGSAIAVFNSIAGAKVCMQKEKGLESAPLKFRLVHDTDKIDSEKIKKMPPAPSSFPATSSFPSSFPSATFSSFPGSAPVPEPSGEGGAVDKDFESIVMMRLRQAEERKRLIEEMKAEEDEG